MVDSVESLRVPPVSYTHLDVYKRQRVHSVTNMLEKHVYVQKQKIRIKDKTRKNYIKRRDEEQDRKI